MAGYDFEFYETGRISVTAGQKAFTGSGTAWKIHGCEGALVIVAGAGAVNFVSSLTTDAAGEFRTAWTGPTLANATYTMWLPSAVAATALANHQRLAEIIATIDKAQPINANLTAIASLVSAADKGIMFTGADAAGIFDLTALGRAMLALTGTNGNIPVMTGSGSVASRPIVGTVSAANNALMETGNNANGFYFRFANRLQVCFNRQFVFDGVRTYQLYGSWTFPAAFNSYNVAFLGAARGATGEASWTADSTLGQGDWGAISFSTISSNFSSVSVGFNKIASAANPGASAKLYGHLVAIGFY